MDGRTFLPLGKSFRAASKEDNIAMFKFGLYLSGTSRALPAPPKPVLDSTADHKQCRSVFPSSASRQLRYIGKTAHSHPRRLVAKSG